MPFVIYLLGATIFALTTSEFMVAGMMPSLTAAFDVTVTEIGHLISLYAAGMVIGGPLLTIGLLRLQVPHKAALLWLLVIYALGGALAAMAPGYGVLAVARVITGVAGSACFGVALAICADLVGPASRGRAASIVLGGLMLSTVFGVPIATVIDAHYGWRASFWLVVVLTALCGGAIAAMVPASRQAEAVSLADELSAFRRGSLWAAFATSALIIGATFAAFSYFAPIVTQVAGFPPAAVPILLVVYGTANVIGNAVVGRFADRYTMPILLGGLLVLAGTLVIFARFADNQVVCVAGLVLVGLAGVPMNPAMIARVMRAAHPGPLVNTLHASVVNIGLGVGSWLGGVGIDAGYGLHAPLWVGAALALIGVLSVLPCLGSRQRGGIGTLESAG